MTRINKYDLENRFDCDIKLKQLEVSSTKNYRVYQDRFGYKYMFSYDTLIMVVNMFGSYIGVTQYFDYSSTTKRHQSNFMRDHGNVSSQNVRVAVSVCLDAMFTMRDIETELFDYLEVSYKALEGGK